MCKCYRFVLEILDSLTFSRTSFYSLNPFPKNTFVSKIASTSKAHITTRNIFNYLEIQKTLYPKAYVNT